MNAPTATKLLLLALAGLTFGMVGCTSQPTIAGSRSGGSAKSARTFALAVTLPDGGRVSNEQWAAIKADFQQQLAAAGYELTDEVARADRIIRVIFSPNEPGSIQGTSTVVRVQANTAYAYQPSISSFGGPFGSYSPAYGYNSHYYRDPIYGYSDGSYSGGSGIVAPRQDPPANSRPNHPVDCPPGSDSSHAGRFAGRGDHEGHWAGRDGREGGSRYGPRSDSGSEGGGRIHVRSSDGGQSSGHASSSGGASSSYSGGSSGSSSSSFSSGSSSSFSSSGSSGGSSGSSGSSSGGSSNPSSGSSNQHAN